MARLSSATQQIEDRLAAPVKAQVCEQRQGKTALVHSLWPARKVVVCLARGEKPARAQACPVFKPLKRQGKTGLSTQTGALYHDYCLKIFQMP
jgi:hypothetical protein